MPLKLAVMLDDTVNQFTKTIKQLDIVYDNRTDDIADRHFTAVFFDKYGNLTEKGRIAFTECEKKTEGIEFINSLNASCSKLILITSRDIRLCYKETISYLKKYSVTYDYLFTATAPAGLCADMGVDALIYNLPDGNLKDRIEICCFNDNKERKITQFNNFKEALTWINTNL